MATKMEAAKQVASLPYCAAGIIPVGASAALAIPRDITDALVFRRCGTGSYTREGRGSGSREQGAGSRGTALYS